MNVSGFKLNGVKLFSFLLLLLGCFPVSTENAEEDPSRAARLDPMKTISNEKRLIRELLGNYERVGKSGRPVLNTSTTTNVNFSLGLIQMDLDERQKLLSMSMWTRYVWRDEYLQWNPAKYGGILSVRLEPHLIWIPDITLYNTATVTPEARDALAVIGYNGQVTWFPHTIFKSSCSVDITNFPFDVQQCHMWFGSWTYSSSEVNLSMSMKNGIDLSTFQSDYRESATWEFISVVATRRVMPSEKANPNFVVLTYDLNIRRKVVFSSYILTLSCVFLAFLTLVVFWLPPERPDRTSLAMSIFSSFMLLLLILVETAPPTASSVPRLGVYYCFNMVIIMLSVMLSTVVVNINAGFDCRAPRWLVLLSQVTLFRCCGRIWKCCRAEQQKMGMYMYSSSISDTTDNKVADSSADVMLTTSLSPPPINAELLNPASEGFSTDSGFPALREVGGFINHREKMDEVSREMSRENARILEERIRHREWQKVAVMFDRLFFVIYVVLIIVSLCLLFPRPA